MQSEEYRAEIKTVSSQSSLSLRIKVIARLLGVMILIHYAWYFVKFYQHYGLFIHQFSDYRVWWAVAHLITQGRFSSIYDLAALYPLENQLNVFSKYQHDWVILPMVYLSVFALPMAPLAMLKPVTGVLFFTFFNITVFLGYLYYFCRKQLVEKPLRAIGLIALSEPGYLNFFFAQVSSYLVIPFGQFLTNALRNNRFYAGLWLSLALLKPQMLIILLPGFIISRQWKVLAGLFLGAAVILTLSFLLVGSHGFISQYAIVSDYHRAFGSYPEGMINWRMFPNLIYLATGQLWNCQLWWDFWFMMILITYVAGLLLWIYPGWSDLPLTLLGTMAATLLCSWHSHPHMALSLLPPLILLLKRPNAKWVFIAWIFIPAIIFGLALSFISEYAALINTFGLLSLNLLLLIWALVTTHTARMRFFSKIFSRLKKEN
jgi:hypothetical protein